MDNYFRVFKDIKIVRDISNIFLFILIMKRVYVLLGTNLGNRELNLEQAIGEMEIQSGKLSERSSLYGSSPWGFESENYFLNMVVGLDTSLSPFKLLDSLQEIENKMGRIRSKEGFEDRIIDLDILLFENEVVNKSDLIIPHASLHNRMFSLMPLAEIAGEYIHPLFQKSIKQLKLECRDKNKVWKIQQ